jgi:hypothetical protein
MNANQHEFKTRLLSAFIRVNSRLRSVFYLGGNIRSGLEPAGKLASAGDIAKSTEAAYIPVRVHARAFAAEFGFLFKRKYPIRVDSHDDVLDGPVNRAENVADAGGDDDDVAGADAPALAAAQFITTQAGSAGAR